MMQRLGVIEIILRDRFDFFAEIQAGVNLRAKILDMLAAAFALFAIYGGVMGAAHSPLQAVSSFIKLPILFLLTLIICTPSLHFFNLLFGSRQTIQQTIALVLTAITTTAVLLASFAPITMFFLLTTSQYDFFKLLNVTFFGIAGMMGIVFLRQGIRVVTASDHPEGVRTRQLIFILWVLLYGFVGSQMAWTLSPFIGEPGREFIVFRQFGGNFYSDVMQSLSQLLFGSGF